MASTVPQIFDPLRRERNQARLAPDAPIFMLERMAQELVDRINAVNRSFENGLIIAPPILNAFFQDALAEQVTLLSVTSFDRLDADNLKGTPANNDKAELDQSSPAPRSRVSIEGEAQQDTLPSEQSSGSYDLICVLGTFHCLNDVPGWLHQFRRALSPDGLLMTSFPGGETLAAVRHILMHIESDLTGGAAQRIHPFISLQDLAHLVQRAGFALPVVDHDLVTIRYSSLGRAIDDLRGMGEGNCLAERHPMRRSVLAALQDRLLQLETSSDGKISFTIDLLYASGWAPSPHQPKPLKPGSAKHRLADALNSEEVALSFELNETEPNEIEP